MMALSKSSLKVRRPEDISIGDWVHVVVRYGSDGSMEKRKRAKVCKVLRKAAVLTDIEGEKKQRTVRFAELELIPPDRPQQPVRRRRTSRRREQLRVVPPAFEDLAEPEEEDGPKVIRRPRSATAAVTEGLRDEKKTQSEEPPSAPEPLDYESWVAKGASVKERLIEESHGLDNEVRGLMAEQLSVEEKLEDVKGRLAAKEEELEKVRNKIALLESLQEEGL